MCLTTKVTLQHAQKYEIPSRFAWSKSPQKLEKRTNLLVISMGKRTIGQNLHRKMHCDSAYSADLCTVKVHPRASMNVSEQLFLQQGIGLNGYVESKTHINNNLNNIN